MPFDKLITLPNGLQRFLRRKQSHIVRFCPDYYLANNKDVRLAKKDPWIHYQKYGWKEGRDPSPIFSTEYYVKESNFLPNKFNNPLSHYTSIGRPMGLRPHPFFDDIELNRIHVGIVSVAYNCSDIAMLTVLSVANARSQIKTTFFLIDGGSSESEKNKLKNFASSTSFKNIGFEFIDLNENLGYSGANNIGIVRARSLGCSHICLLNPDVVVTDFWLDRMIEEGEPFISPVCNSVGNEQTVPMDYQIDRTIECFSVVNEFSTKWSSAFLPIKVKTKFVGFFCALIKSEIFDIVGLLDERFFPGGYEDLDFCLRARNLGIDLWIARNIYIHHWGSASFSNLPMNDRIASADVNRKRYEDKHGEQWEDWKATIFRAAILDISNARQDVSHEIRLFQHKIFSLYQTICDDLISELSSDGLNMERLLDHGRNDRQRLTDVVKQIESQRDELANILKNFDENYSIPARLTISPLFEVITARSAIINFPDLSLKSNSEASYYSEFFYLLAQELVFFERPHSWAMKLLLPALQAFAKLIDHPIVIFANGADPIEGDEKDGFVQRVLEIDYLFNKAPRIYVRVRPEHADAYRISSYPDGLFIFDLCSTDPVYSALLSALVKWAKVTYLHSILPLGDTRIRNSILGRSGIKIIDMHGAVPEEFDMYNDKINSVLFNSYEKLIVKNVSAIVCVSNAMAKHLCDKHMVPEKRMIICPIFSKKKSAKRNLVKKEGTLPRVIYAGGTQLWQCIPEMAKTIAAVCDRVDFLFLTPNPEALKSLLLDAGVPEAKVRTCVRSASHDQVLSEYVSSDYGFIVRRDSVVNKVSCPTKLIEYILHGVVPIIDSKWIGDFVDLGLRYVKIEDFKEGLFPSEEERQEILSNNYSVIERLSQISDLGLSDIKKAIYARD